MSTEQFKDVGDCPITSVEIEDGSQEWAESHIGEIWLGAEWINVKQARALRDWLNQVIP
jgi:hypothetical protein